MLRAAKPLAKQKLFEHFKGTLYSRSLSSISEGNVIYVHIEYI